MRTAQISYLCCLLLAAASESTISECGADADPSCVTDKDSAALLQSTVEIHGVASALKSTVHYSTQASADCADTEEDACRSEAKCTWSKSSGCEIGCETFKQKSSCPDDYCFWRLVDGKNKKCMETIDSMNLGGKEAGASTLGGGSGTKMSDVLNRPAYKTSSRSEDKGETWKACGGEEDCFYTGGTSDIKATLGKKSEYTDLAVDFAINCDLKTDLKIIYDVRKSSNFKLKVTYNSKEVEVKWGNTKWGKRKMTVQINSDDTYPILGLQISRKDDDEEARFTGQVRLKDVMPSFDQCMETKGQHGQCLAKLPLNHVLRSSHAAQQKCVNGDDESEACSEWTDCLTTGSSVVIGTVISAFDWDVPDPELLLQDSTQVWQNASGNDNCKSGGHGECKDPSQIDIEEFDCNCFDWVEGKTAEQINLAICGSPQVCCTWKEEHCKKPYPTPHSALIQNAMTLRGEDTKAGEQEASLDDSLSGKRTAGCDLED